MADEPGRSPPEPQRAHARVRAQVDAFVRLIGDNREYVFRARDLSEGGLFLFTRVGHLYPFKLGSDLSIELHEDQRVLTLRGVIARIVEPGAPEASQYPVGFGVQLLPLTPEERTPLLALVDKLSRTDPRD